MSAQGITKNDGGTAFPIVASTGDPRDGLYCRDGMSLRDHFAAQALNGYLSGRNTADRTCMQDAVAKACYDYADAMLKARQA